MGTFVTIIDALILLLLIVYVPFMVWREKPQGGSFLLSLCVAAAVILMAWVSFMTYLSLFTSALAQIVWLVVLLLIANHIRAAWASPPAA
jgi:hypothetical protein